MKDTDRAILEFESRHPRMSGRKEELMRSELTLTPARYFQRLFWLVERAEVVAEFPQLAGRVQRRRKLATVARARRAMGE